MDLGIVPLLCAVVPKFLLKVPPDSLGDFIQRFFASQYLSLESASKRSSVEVAW
jgi:hypothetical protein